jgi:hypothetical protein
MSKLMKRTRCDWPNAGGNGDVESGKPGVSRRRAKDLMHLSSLSAASTSPSFRVRLAPTVCCCVVLAVIRAASHVHVGSFLCKSSSIITTTSHPDPSPLRHAHTRPTCSAQLFSGPPGPPSALLPAARSQLPARRAPSSSPSRSLPPHTSRPSEATPPALACQTMRSRAGYWTS